MTGWTSIQLYKERGAFFAIVSRHAWRPGEWMWACYLTEARHRQLWHRARGRSKSQEEACRQADENMHRLGLERLEWSEDPINARLRLDALRHIAKLRSVTKDPVELKELDEQRERFLKKRVKK